LYAEGEKGGFVDGRGNLWRNEKRTVSRLG